MDNFCNDAYSTENKNTPFNSVKAFLSLYNKSDQIKDRLQKNHQTEVSWMSPNGPRFKEITHGQSFIGPQSAKKTKKNIENKK